MLSATQNIATIMAFADQVDTDRLFDSLDGTELIHQRVQLNDALRALLLWQRPELENDKGLDWPYRVFRERAAFFTRMVNATGSETQSPEVKKEALLFLALLPFPDQWQWFRKACRAYPKAPELMAQLASETGKISRKLNKKKQKQYKLRHFCQVLKKPRLPEEKGVLRIFALPYIFADGDLLNELRRFYILYIEPPIGVAFRQTWLRRFSHGTDPCLFGVCGAEDARFLSAQTNTWATQLAHAEYLDERIDLPPKTMPQYDIVFNGTFDEMDRKRHRRMLELLQESPLRHCTAVFLGRGSEDNIAAFNQMVRAKALEGRVQVLTNLKRGEVPEILAKCRMGVHLSLNENGCRAIYEFMRSDIPQVVNSSMAGTNMDIFTPQTGLAVKEHALAATIRHVVDHTVDFAPREWFLANSGSTIASRQVNGLLKNLFLHSGYVWREDIVKMTSSGVSRYADPNDIERFRPQFIQLLDIIRGKTRIPIRLSVD
ncbi:glycosyltransferase [Desulfosarcina ovata]|uniref:Glycosyl transferase family 1 domain-containing protein n=1 Tax=Desulfosarcina ovata subsp. ovata TaxID=2752305 RepID=A0A5K8AL97_9BACT|nr:glycosyltransferase [Desulfosarcina ovata]BBO93452.1 hypothetical protein DSCOOX_66320 [Desulfosarcina ovata subsp. ovata]